MAAPTGTRSQTNGVLAVTASQTSGNAQRPASGRPPLPRLKVVIRRLPPGLTTTEFAAVLGEDWKTGQGKVDWFLYKPGKDSKDPSKPSRPSRAYLHLTNESHLINLSDLVRQSTFEDAQHTFTSPCLVGPPSVEFAPYGRIPSTRQRVDARAGTIDQDAEFMAFLEGLANPVSAKEVAIEGTETGKVEKVTSTPLVQYLKEKKANKIKEAAAKATKKQEAQVAKVKAKDPGGATEGDVKKKGKDAKVEKAAKEAVKILNREAAKTAAKTSTAEPSGSDTSTTPKLDTSRIPGRQRGAVVAAHIRMLQRDLGLSPAQAHRQVRRDTEDAKKAEKATAAEKAASETKDAASSQLVAPPVPTAPKGNQSQASSRRGRGRVAMEAANNKTTTSASSATTNAGPSAPVILLKKSENQQPSTTNSGASPAQHSKPSPVTSQTAKSAPAALSRKPQPPAIPSEGATQAFVKHANPSQGVTESLLKEAMEKYGAVSMVEIDKRKGFAYVDFVDTEGLKKAMAANPISVAQGTVHVMQRKGTGVAPEKKVVTPQQQAPHTPRGGGGRGGRGGTVGRRGGRGGRGGGGAGTASATEENVKPSPSIPTGPAAVE